MATTVNITVVSTAMTGSDVSITLPVRNANDWKFLGVVIQPVGGNVSLLGPDGTAFTLQSAQCYPFTDPSWGGLVLVFNGANTTTIQTLNQFGVGV